MSAQEKKKTREEEVPLLLDAVDRKLDDIYELLRQAHQPTRLFGPTIAFSHAAETVAGVMSMRKLVEIFWGDKWKIISITSVFSVLSVIYALSMPNIYRSEALLYPADQGTVNNISSMASSLGGLASLAGINIGAHSGEDKSELALKIVRSREFISYFIQKRRLLVPLMAVSGWDAQRNELIIDADVYNSESGAWVRKVSFPKKQIPTIQEATEKFLEYFDVFRDNETGFVVFSIEYYSPEISKQWVDWLVEDLNLVVKSRDVDEAEKSINYLVDQSKKTANADMRSMFFELVEEQSKIIMFAEVRQEYAFKTVDKAVVPEEKYKPRRSVYCILSTLLGLMIASFGIVISHFWRESSSHGVSPNG